MKYKNAFGKNNSEKITLKIFVSFFLRVMNILKSGKKEQKTYEYFQSYCFFEIFSKNIFMFPFPKRFSPILSVVNPEEIFSNFKDNESPGPNGYVEEPISTSIPQIIF